jgi:HAD superfamily hydrolase (TIGR01509 family)
MSPLAAVIFDFDGIIIDSETPEYESHRRIFDRCGVALTTDEWCDQIGVWTEGHDERWFRELCARSANAPDHDAYHAEKRRIFDEVVPDAPMRGIRELLGQLAVAGVPAAIASSSPASWVVRMMERLGLRPLVGAIVSGDDVVRRKPAPDVYLEAARRLDAGPEGCVAIEDSTNGIRSAHAAGMAVVAVPNGDFPPEESAVQLAALVLGSLTELTPEAIRALGCLNQ